MRRARGGRAARIGGAVLILGLVPPDPGRGPARGPGPGERRRAPLAHRPPGGVGGPPDRGGRVPARVQRDERQRRHGLYGGRVTVQGPYYAYAPLVLDFQGNRFVRDLDVSGSVSWNRIQDRVAGRLLVAGAKGLRGQLVIPH